MTRIDYRRKAVLARVGATLDRFYMSQEIDWDYDIRSIIDQILALALTELEFREGKALERGLIIVPTAEGGELEVGGGWRVEDDLSFSRTIVERTMREGASQRFENVRTAPELQQADSLRGLDVLSLMAVPIRADTECLGALYIESRDPAHMFSADDQAFLEEFARTIAPYIKTALLHQKHVAEIRALRERAERGAAVPHFLGRSNATARALDLARVAASVERTVLITGESGTGKELLAHAIHALSRRKDGPFIVVDCSALSENLLESELFGHRRGSFTGAVTDKPGAFEDANGGTLFLDEISDAPLPLQQKLRRVLQESEIRRVGENQQRHVDVRVICATNRDLQQEVANRRFLHDLYHRIHQFPIALPPLRARKEDVPLLVEHFIALNGGRKNPPVRGIEPDALAVLVARDWRANNVRELKNVVDLAVDLAAKDHVDRATVERTLEIRGDLAGQPDAALAPVAALPVVPGELLSLAPARVSALFAAATDDAPKEERPYYRLQREFSGKVILESLRFTSWKVRNAARLLGVSPVKLRQDLRAYLTVLLAGHDGDLRTLSELLHMPESALRRKLRTLGVELPPGASRTRATRAHGSRGEALRADPPPASGPPGGTPRIDGGAA